MYIWYCDSGHIIFAVGPFPAKVGHGYSGHNFNGSLGGIVAIK